AGADQFVERAKGLLDRDLGVRDVELVEVNMVRAQTTKAVLDGTADIVGVGALALVVQLRSELGGDDGVRAATGEGPAEILLALPHAVDVRGVEEVDPGIECGVDHLCGPGLIDARAEVQAAKPNDRDLEGAYPSLFHMYLRLPDSSVRSRAPLGAAHPGQVTGGGLQKQFRPRKERATGHARDERHLPVA